MAYKQIKKYGYRDSLEKGDPEKVIYGVDFDAEFEAIEQAFDGVPGAGGDPIAPETPGFEDVVFQTRTEDQQVVSKFTFAVAGQAPLTVENTGIWNDVNYVRYDTVDATWKVAPGLEVDGDFTVNGETSLNGNLNVDGDIDATGNLNVDQNVTIGGYIDGDLTVNGNITIEGGTIIDGGGENGHLDPGGDFDGVFPVWDATAEKWIATSAQIFRIVDMDKTPPQGANLELKGYLDCYGVRTKGVGSETNANTGITFALDGVIGPYGASGDLDIGNSVSKFGNAWFAYAVNAGSFVKTGGTATQLLRADGTVEDATTLVKTSGNQTIAGVKTFSNDMTVNGTVTANAIVSKGNVTAYSSSDERLKDDITPMPVGLIDAINASQWKWKEDGRSSGGVIAQQLQEIGLDDWVREAPNGDLGVDYNALIGMLIAEVQDLKRRLADG